VKHGPVTKRSGTARCTGRALVAAAISFAGLALSPASAQTASPPEDAAQAANRLEILVKTLPDGVSCNAGNPRDILEERGRKSGASPADIGAAMAIISSSGSVCDPVRAAASSLSADLAAQRMAALPPEPENPTDAASRAALAARASQANEALEAEARAASTRFDLGPPPRNLTRGRIAGL
jgi:hypothetical protein